MIIIMIGDCSKTNIILTEKLPIIGRLVWNLGIEEKVLEEHRGGDQCYDCTVYNQGGEVLLGPLILDNLDEKQIYNTVRSEAEKSEMEILMKGQPLTLVLSSSGSVIHSEGEGFPNETVPEMLGD